MNKSAIILTIALLTFAFAGETMNGMSGMSDMKGMNHQTKPTVNTVMTDKLVICPVSGEKILPEKAFNSTVYKGKTYYFCCKACKPMFEKNPTKYLNKK
ncbi:MAG: YHS domain-containing protein [Candidatus Riflemargulisbacteria bacterium]